jgi:hypothetical protein
VNQVPEIELDQRGRTGWNGMHDHSIANPGLALGVEPNESCKAPRGLRELDAVHGRLLRPGHLMTPNNAIGSYYVIFR